MLFFSTEPFKAGFPKQQSWSYSPSRSRSRRPSPPTAMPESESKSVSECRSESCGSKQPVTTRLPKSEAEGGQEPTNHYARIF